MHPLFHKSLCVSILHQITEAISWNQGTDLDLSWTSAEVIQSSLNNQMMIMTAAKMNFFDI